MEIGPASGSDARPRGYVIIMMLLLCIATFCEGYDFFIISLVIDILPGEFGVSMNYVIKVVLTLINVGAILGFFVIRLGDRFGRKPILLISLCGFTTFSVITAMSPSIWVFMAAQFIAKMFLVSQFG
ncbi:MAG TPA: MFS transporter, partial [bacterium]|nr:MFS transporter [bacterium]